MNIWNYSQRRWIKLNRFRMMIRNKQMTMTIPIKLIKRSNYNNKCNYYKIRLFFLITNNSRLQLKHLHLLLLHYILHQYNNLLIRIIHFLFNYIINNLYRIQISSNWINNNNNSNHMHNLFHLHYIHLRIKFLLQLIIQLQLLILQNKLN